jgi:hypothetical protein
MSATMAAAAFAFQMLDPSRRDFSIGLIAITLAVAIVFLLWLNSWFKKSLSEALARYNELIDQERSRHLSAIKEIGNA